MILHLYMHRSYNYDKKSVDFMYSSSVLFHLCLDLSDTAPRYLFVVFFARDKVFNFNMYRDSKVPAICNRDSYYIAMYL